MDSETLNKANILRERINDLEKSLKELSSERYHTMVIKYGDISLAVENRSDEFYAIKELVVSRLEKYKKEFEDL